MVDPSFERYPQVNGKAENDEPFGDLVTLSDFGKCSVKLRLPKLHLARL